MRTHDYEKFIRQVTDYAIFRIDLDGTILSWNEGVQVMLGYSEDEWVGLSTYAIFTPEDVRKQSPRWEMDLAAQEGYAGDNRWHLRKDGTRFWANGSMNVVRNEDGSIIGFIKVLQDRTQERSAELALRQAHIQLESAVEAGGVITWFWDVENDRLTGNRALAGLFDINPEEAEQGVPLVRFLTAVHEGDRERVEQAMRSAADTGQAFDEEYRVIDSAGSTRWVTVRGRPRPDQDAISIELPGVLIDISEQKATEALLKDLNELLNREYETLNYSVSHDLRSPLRSIHGFSQVLIEDYASVLDEPGLVHLQRISAAATRMGEVMDALIELARIPRLSVEPRDIDLGELAGQVCRELQDRYEHPVQLSIGGGLRTRGDARLLRQALSQLLDNAFKYTVGVENPTVEVGRMESDGLEPFFVRDNGVGFYEDHAKRIFEPFHRLDVEEDGEDGLGVGLAIAQQVVHKHGGLIWAEGTPGRGVSVYFTLERS